MRVRTNFATGMIESPGLTAESSTLQSASLANFPVIIFPNFAVIILDPLASDGIPEIAYIVDHTAGAASATIVRGRENTTARAHAVGIQWMHGAVASDFKDNYIHEQPTPSNTWTVNHPLDGYPQVTSINENGEEVIGNVNYPSTNQVVITFTIPVAGKASLR